MPSKVRDLGWSEYVPVVQAFHHVPTGCRDHLPHHGQFPPFPDARTASWLDSPFTWSCSRIPPTSKNPYVHGSARSSASSNRPPTPACTWKSPVPATTGSAPSVSTSSGGCGVGPQQRRHLHPAQGASPRRCLRLGQSRKASVNMATGGIELREVAKMDSTLPRL